MASSTRPLVKIEPASKLPYYVMGALVLVGLAIFAYIQFSPSKSVPETPLSAEARAYAPNLKLSEVTMKATKNYFSQELVEVEGNIHNTGDRAIDQIEVYCTFYDPDGQLVLRARLPIVSHSGGGLKPGETKAFRLPFDQIPQSWNQVQPRLEIAGAKFS